MAMTWIIDGSSPTSRTKKSAPIAECAWRSCGTKREDVFGLCDSQLAAFDLAAVVPTDERRPKRKTPLISFFFFKKFNFSDATDDSLRDGAADASQKRFRRFCRTAAIGFPCS